MSTRTPVLNNKDHTNLTAFLGHVLEDFKAGEITKDEAIGGIAHMVAAVDRGEYQQASKWLEQGRSLIRATR